jgi:fructose-bisphosphate aldolase class I
MNLAELNKVAEAMVAPGRGILAADESSGTIKKRFDAIGAESTADSRRDYREFLFRSSEAMSKYISGVILYDETIRQNAKDGTPLVKLIEAAGAIPGIKVDKGTTPLPFCPGEVITEGLDGLRERLAEYRRLGARFAKWRAVIDIGPGIPSYAALITNANALARYAALCQEGDIVPIVEPEVLMDGDHDAERCYVITEWVLKTVFEQLYYQKVALEGMVLKPNMVIAGKKAKNRAGVEEVAEKTVKVLKACVPAAVPGMAFLSGGESDAEETAYLEAMNRIGDLPWRLTFSYGRALVPRRKAWSGKSENVAAAQRAFVHRAMMNSLAARGQWKQDLEEGGVSGTDAPIDVRTFANPSADAAGAAAASRRRDARVHPGLRSGGAPITTAPARWQKRTREKRHVTVVPARYCRCFRPCRAAA